MNIAYWRIVGIVSLWQVAASVCYYSVFAATPFFRDAFGLSRFWVGIVVTLLTLGYAAFLLPLGALTDRYGEHRSLVAGLLGLSIGALGVIASWSYPTLLLAVFLLGAAYGTAMPGTNRAIFSKIAEGRQNFAMGIKQVGVTAGSGISAVLVTRLASRYSWRAGFAVAAGFGVVVTALFWTTYESGSGADEFEYPNFRRLLGNAPYVALTAAGLFLGACLFTTVGYTILFVDESVGATVGFAGMVLATVQVAGSVGRIVTGWLADRLPGSPRRRTGAILLAQAAGGTVLLALVPQVDSRASALAAFAGLGFFVLGYTGMYYSCMSTLVSADEMGGATAGGQLALTAGALVAPPAFGRLTDAVGYRAGWTFLAALGAVATLLLVRVIYTAPPSDVVTAQGSTGASDD